MNQAVEMNWPEVIKACEEKFEKSAPSTINFERESFFAIQHIQNNDFLRKVARENPISVQAAMINVSTIGLSLNPAKRQAYLIPRNIKTKDANGKDKWISKVCFEPSYMGLCDLATMSGSIKWVQANIVYKNDQFEDNGPGEKPTHKYDAFAKLADRGEFVGVYCVAKTDGGDYLTTIMPAEDVYSIRDRSEAWKRKIEKEAKGQRGFGGPWETDFNEQAKKTVIRRGFKTWPKTETLDRMEMAVHLSNENEGFEPILTSPNVGEYTAEQKKHLDHMIEKDMAVEMYLFSLSVGDSTFTSLYHSFEKGTKGKYQQIINKLLQSGQNKLMDLQAGMNDCAERGDDHGMLELIEDLSKDTLDHLSGVCSNEAAAMLRELATPQEQHS